MHKQLSTMLLTLFTLASTYTFVTNAMEQEQRQEQEPNLDATQDEKKQQQPLNKSGSLQKMRTLPKCFRCHMAFKTKEERRQHHPNCNALKPFKALDFNKPPE